MNQRFFWLIVCGMFCCLLGFLFIGLGSWMILRGSDEIMTNGLLRDFFQFQTILVTFIGAAAELIGLTSVCLGIRSILKDSP